jgi:cell division protein ZapA (FtsZ GTPase activity inhibitor)
MLIRTGCEHPELSERARNIRSIAQGCERRRHQNDDEGTAAKRQVAEILDK